jgi:flagellar hook assembly protein FlgD
MTQRVLTLTAALAVFVVAAAAVAADKVDKPADNTHSGVVVSVSDGKLTMADKDGKNEHAHSVAKDAKITCDGKECKLDDLKKGETVTVTTKDGDPTVAVKIDATSPNK